MSFDINIVKQGGIYKSCIWLNRDMYLGHAGLSSCCIPRIVGGYDGNDPFNLDWSFISEKVDNNTVYDKDFFDDMFARKLEYIRKLNDNETCVCTGCDGVEHKEWMPVPKLKIQRFVIGADNLCNCNCVYCPQDHSARSKYNFYNAIKGAIDLGVIDMSDPNTTVVWGGGEPTVMEGLDKVLELIGPNANNCKHMFFTTGIKYEQQISDYMSRATDCGVMISIDSGTPETYKVVKRVDQFHNVVENIKKYHAAAKYKNRVSIKYIVKEENCSEQEIDSFLQIISDNNLHSMTIFIDTDFHSQGRPSDRVMAGVYYLALRVPLVAQLRFYFDGNLSNRVKDLNEKLRMPEMFFGRLLIHKIEEKGIDIQDIIQYVREL